ncbi:leucine-rich repeat-containing protein 20-like isoform X2 [Artemia franciscana]|uniref:leucine-rich repeat-containing protein 20-like isoform X2 n=1 Tax=Artemia franciscana TaxID=6661 RepID=UPI0032DA14EF
MASSVAKIVNRCEDAKENDILDLSDCELAQVPDAVFHLMRQTDLSKCDLSFNSMTKIPAKLATNFVTLTDLNISHNRMTKLPDQIAQLTNLLRLDISHNSFSNFPYVVFGLTKIVQVNAEQNQISDVEVERLSGIESLQKVNLTENPLTRQCRKNILDKPANTLVIVVSPEAPEDWEDDLGDYSD